MPVLPLKTMVFTGYVMVLIALGFWAWRIAKSKSPCSDFTFRTSAIYELLDSQSHDNPQEMVIIHINPDCYYCSLLLKELSNMETLFKIYLVSYRNYREALRFVDQFSWINQPQIILSTKPLVERAFCSSATPSLLVVSNGTLIYSQLGLGKNSELKLVIGK